jgi:probable rRNA maturation factor
VRERQVYVSPWRIDVTVREGVACPAPIARLARAIAVALDAAGAPSPASLGLILSDDRELTELNRVHMGADGPTDVLSFPLLPPEAFPSHEGGAPHPDPADAARAVDFVAPPGRTNLGDIVVSVERATEQAVEGRGGQTSDVAWAPADEMRLLVTHGALHICGWDHAEPGEEAAMRGLEQRLLGTATGSG